MKKFLLSISMVAILCSLFVMTCQAEVKLTDYHLLSMKYSTTNTWDYLQHLYELRFKQYGKAVTSTGMLDPSAISYDQPVNVPASGEVLVVYIPLPSLLHTDSIGQPDGTGLFRYYSSGYGGFVSMEKVAQALSAFPGKVVVVVNSRLEEYDSISTREAVLAAVSSAFPAPKFTLVAHIMNRFGTIPTAPSAFGYTQDVDCKPLAKIYADTNNDKIVTAKEYYDYRHTTLGDSAVGLFRGDDLPIFFSTDRTKLEMAEKTHTLTGSESFTVNLNIEPVGATDFMTWSSVGPGTTDIVLNADGKTLKMKVTVKLLKPVSVSIVPPENDVYMDSSFMLSVKYEPANATDTIVSWASSNQKVATVNKKGAVTALRDGKTTITVKTKRGLKAQYPLTVKKVEVAKVYLEDNDDPSPLILQATIGIAKNYVAHVLPRDASFKGIRWTTSNASVASVTNGKVSFKKPGSAVVRAVSVDNPSAFFEIQYTVRDNRHVWSAPNSSDYAGKPAGVYVSPKELYYSGSKLMAEVYLFNQTSAQLKFIGPLRQCLIDLHYFNMDPAYEEDYLLYAKKAGRYTFKKPIAPEGFGVYKFSISLKTKIDLNFRPDYAPLLLADGSILSAIQSP